MSRRDLIQPRFITPHSILTPHQEVQLQQPLLTRIRPRAVPIIIRHQVAAIHIPHLPITHRELTITRPQEVTLRQAVITIRHPAAITLRLLIATPPREVVMLHLPMQLLVHILTQRLIQLRHIATPPREALI